MTFASEVGVLGYPMQNILFNKDGSDVDINSLILRADKGIVNAIYTDENNIAISEFTMGFNPGNSGGPIMDIRTGNVVAMVHGYRSQPIKAAKESFDSQVIEGMEDEEGEIQVISVVRALYSIGLCTLNYLPYEGKHKISFK